MPLPAAYTLIAKKLNEVKRRKFGAPDAMTSLIYKAVEGNKLADYEYRAIIRTIHERWLKQRVLEKRLTFEEGSV